MLLKAKREGKNAVRTAEEANHRECGMSRTCSLERVALEPRLFAKSIGIRKPEQGGEGAAGREQGLGKEESETFLLVCHRSQSKGL